MEKLIKVLEIGFSALTASIMTLIVVLYTKLSNIEDVLNQKFRGKEENE